MNTALYRKMIDAYKRTSASKKYILGFRWYGSIYAATISEELLPAVCKISKASRGAGYSLRFIPAIAQKQILLRCATLEIVCSEKYFDELAANMKKIGYNFGETFEKIITEKAGFSWEKDFVPYYKDGDIVLNGERIQIKFEKSTLVSEKTLMNIGA